MATTKVKAEVCNRAAARFRNDKIKTQAYTDEVSKQIVEAGDSTAIGRMGEYLVMEQLEDLGFKVKLLSGTDSCDLKVKIGQSWKRVEVKTSTAGHNTTVRKDGTRSKKYSFNAIKTELFDMVVFVFVDYDQTVIKVGGAEARKFVNLWGSDAMNGKIIVFPENYRHCKEFGQEVLLDINKKNVRLSLK